MRDKTKLILINKDGSINAYRFSILRNNKKIDFEVSSSESNGRSVWNTIDGITNLSNGSTQIMKYRRAVLKEISDKYDIIALDNGKKTKI